MNRNAIETVMGAVVLVVAAVFLFFAYRTSQVRAITGYDVSAVFDRVGGLRDGGEVRLNGIPIGSVISQTLDAKNGFTAVVKMSIDESVKLPADSKARIASNGLLGDNYLAIVPGIDEKMIPPGGMILDTTPPFDLESVIGQLIYSFQGSGQKKEDSTGGGQKKDDGK
jgi:phospholipid/cholesterol/gamma-HCH transport system substrate-binding protein